jgi:hypothetical protein
MTKIFGIQWFFRNIYKTVWPRVWYCLFVYFWRSLFLAIAWSLWGFFWAESIVRCLVSKCFISKLSLHLNPSPLPKSRSTNWTYTQYCAKFVEKIRKPNIYRNWACRSLFLKVVFVVGVMLAAKPCRTLLLRYHEIQIKKTETPPSHNKRKYANIHIEA